MGLQDYFTQTLKKDENVVAIIRKHWITLVGPILIGLIVLGLLIGFYTFFFSTVWGVAVWLGIFALTAIYVTYRWIVHFFDSFIITDLRIIDVDQKGLFKRTVSETTFDKVQDVTYSIVGIIATSMDYGAVTVQTAAAESTLELDYVAHPRRIHEIILEAQELFTKRNGSDMSAQELIELISEVKGKSRPGDQDVQEDNKEKNERPVPDQE